MAPGKRAFFTLTVMAVVCSWAAAAFGLEPPTPEQLRRYRADGTLRARIEMARSYGNHLITPEAAARLRDRLERIQLQKKGLKAVDIDRVMAPPPSWKGMPTRGTVKVLALLIAFNDYPPVTPAGTIDSRLFQNGDSGFPYESMHNYYQRASYGQLNITGDVLGWYTTPYARSSVAETSTGRDNLIKEALNYYESQGHDFSQYDNDGDGYVDYFCVFWTGPHGEWASFWWGYYTSFSDSSFVLDGKRFRKYSWQWELANYPSGNFTPRVIIHETGHALGVPDYYDYDDSVGPRGGVGGLDIMDANVGDHNCFSKFMLEWITPTVVSAGPQAVSLRASGLYPDALIFMPDAVPGRIFSEFFMVQNRQRAGNDTGLFTGTDGLVVWHVDSRLNVSNTNFLYNNSYTEHKLLKLVQADGLEQVELYDANADAGDYYQAGMVFGPSTNPDSRRYDGTPTGMGITNIVGATSPISLDVFSSDARPSCSITNIGGGQVLYGTVNVAVEAGDDNGISRVELYTDSILRQSLTAPPYIFSLDTRLFTNGPHSISAVAYDTIMQTTTSTVSVNIDNIYAPAELSARKVVNRGALLYELINVLTWNDDPKNTSLASYRVYLETSDGGRELLTEVPKSQSGSGYSWLHRRVAPGRVYTYQVVGVGAGGREGDVARATAR
jgi:M6 family metalloprotease-like protein